MGVKSINKLYNKTGCVRECQLGELAGQTVAVDISIYIHNYLRRRKGYLESFIDQIIAFWESGIRPVYVFDGRPPDAKAEVLQDRSERKAQAAEKEAVLKMELDSATDATDAERWELQKQITRAQSQQIGITSEVCMALQRLFTLLGVQYLVARGEAEALCAKLNQLGQVDACVSDDTDILPNGGEVWISKLNIYKRTANIHYRDEILEALVLDDAQFVDMCILAGCDYMPRSIRGVSIIRAHQFIQKHGSLEGVVEYIRKGDRYIVPENYETDYKQARKLFADMEITKDVEVSTQSPAQSGGAGFKERTWEILEEFLDAQGVGFGTRCKLETLPKFGPVSSNI